MSCDTTTLHCRMTGMGAILKKTSSPKNETEKKKFGEIHEESEMQNAGL